MDKNRIYQGKHILVTGASTRTGYAVSQYLAGQGATLIVNYRNDISGIEKMIAEHGEDKIIPVQGDVGLEKDVERIFEQTNQRLGKLDGLVNTVGEYIEKPVMTIDFKNWRRILDNNLDSVFLMCKTFYPLLKLSGQGRVINFGYTNGDRIVASKCVPYHIAKMGVLSLTKTFAKEWGESGVTANVISPGTIFNSVTKDSENPSDYIPMGRFGEYRDFWPILDMIFRDDSDYLTGNNFVPSGGYNI